MPIARDDTASVLPGEDSDQTIGEVDRRACLFHIMRQPPGLDPLSVSRPYIQERERFDHVFDDRDLPRGPGALDKFRQDDARHADLAAIDDLIDHLGQGEIAAPEIIDPDRRVDDDLINAHCL